MNAIIHKGFEERHAYVDGVFGARIYFAENSSKRNQYVYGIGDSVFKISFKKLFCVVLGHNAFILFSFMWC